MSKLVELEETMTNATLFAVNKERDRIVRSFVENGFDLTKVSLKSFERVIKDKLWLAWQNAFAMGYEDEVQFGGADVDVAEFAKEGKINVNRLATWVEKYYDLLDLYREEPKNTELKKRLEKSYDKIGKLKETLSEEFVKRNNEYLSLRNKEDRKLANYITDLESLIGTIDEFDDDYKRTVLKTTKGISEAYKLDKQILSQAKRIEKESVQAVKVKTKKKRKPFEPTSYTEQFKQRTKVERLQESTKRKIRGYEAQLENLKNRNDDNANRLKIQLQNKIDTQKKILNDAVETLGDKTDTVVESALTDKFVEKTKQNKIYREVLERLQKDTTTNRANAISFLNQTDFGRVYLENRLDYIARIQSGREYDVIKKRLTESVKDQSDPIINNANETVIQRFFENMASMRYDTQLRVTKDKNNANQLSEADKSNLPLSKQRYDETIKNIPNFIVNDWNVMDMIYRRIKNAMYPDRLTFINTAKDILQNSQTNENGKYRLNEEQSRNFGFINKNEITKQTLQKYRNFTGAELKDYFASGIQRVFVTEIHAAHHLGRLTYYHLNDVKLVKWQLDDEKKTIDAPCDRCLYAGNNNSKRLASILSYESPSSWFEKKAKEVVNLSDSLDNIVTFAKDPIIYVNPLYAGRTDQDLKAIIKDRKNIIKQLQKNNIDVTEELQKVSVLEDELKNRLNLIKQSAKDAKKIAKQAAEEQNWIKKNPMKDPTVTKYEKDTPQSNILSQPTEGDKAEPTKPTQVSQTKRNKNTSQQKSNNISQPTPTEKKPYKTVDVSQLKGIYFFDELLTDVNLSIPRHPYCRCRIVRLPYNEEQTLLALLGGEETVASAVSTGLGAASSLTMEEMIAAKETTKENRQWWTGLGKGAAIGAGILGAGFMMWYFIKTLGKTKAKTAVKGLIEKGSVKVDDVVKAGALQKISQEPLPRVPKKAEVARQIAERLKEQENQALLPDLATLKPLQNLEPRKPLPDLGAMPTGEPLPNLGALSRVTEELTEDDMEIVNEVESFIGKFDILTKNIESSVRQLNPIAKNTAEDQLENFGQFLKEVIELKAEGANKEKIEEAQEKAKRLQQLLNRGSVKSLSAVEKEELYRALYDFSNKRTKLTDKRLANLEDKLKMFDESGYLDPQQNITKLDLPNLNARTYRKWLSDLKSYKNELEELDKQLLELKTAMPMDGEGATLSTYISNAIEELGLTNQTQIKNLKQLKNWSEKHAELIEKVRLLQTRLIANKQKFMYKTKTELQPDPLLQSSVTKREAMDYANELLKKVKDTNLSNLRTLNELQPDTLDNLLENYANVIKDNNEKVFVNRLRKRRDFVELSDLIYDVRLYRKWRSGERLTEYETKRLNKIKSSVMYLLDYHVKRLSAVEFKRGYEGAEFSWRNMTLREACNIVQSRYSSFSTMSH